MSSIAASADRYVAVGRDGTDPGWNGAIWTSSDGVVWQRLSLPSSFGGPIRGVIHDRLGFIAWGSDGSPPTRAAVWDSPDGSVWERAPDIPSFAMVDITGVARLGDRLVAVGGDALQGGAGSFLAWTSSDGRDWRPVSVTGPVDVSPNGLAATDRVLVATTDDRTVLRSTDGLDWQMVTRPEASIGWMGDVVGSGDGFVAVGMGPQPGQAGSPPGPSRAWSSSDGLTWDRAVSAPQSLGLLGLLVRHGNEYVALGWGTDREVAWRSADGRTWTSMSSVPDTAREGLGQGCAGGPCPPTMLLGLADGPRGPIAVGGTQLTSGGDRAVVWVLR
jgi:hypothetical protein